MSLAHDAMPTQASTYYTLADWIVVLTEPRHACSGEPTTALTTTIMLSEEYYTKDREARLESVHWGHADPRSSSHRAIVP